MGIAISVLAGGLALAPQSAADDVIDAQAAYGFCSFMQSRGDGREVNCNILEPVALARCMDLAGGMPWQAIMNRDTPMWGRQTAANMLSGAANFYCPSLLPLLPGGV